MSSSIRLSEELIREAEEQVKSSHRSVPKQIEFWAQIGKEAEQNMTSADIVALVNREIEVKIFRKMSEPVAFDQVFNAIEVDRKNGVLQNKIVKDKIWYEESSDFPGFLIRVTKNGQRDIGSFVDGKFKTMEAKKKLAK